jgi:hypothetical protein
LDSATSRSEEVESLLGSRAVVVIISWTRPYFYSGGSAIILSVVGTATLVLLAIRYRSKTRFGESHPES